MKIAISAIAKNESQFVERFCESAREADLIQIADTGSTDDTVARAIACGADVHEICISPWRFDLARNAAIALLPKDVDIIVSLDLDEVLEPGWRQEIERVWKEDTTRLRYKFDWGQGISFFYEKIFSRHGYRFHHSCHEYPVPDARTREVWASTEKLLVRHLPDSTKSRGQYLDLLKVAVTEDPNCPRNAFYYARELTFNYRWQDSIVELNRYLALPGATWPNERCYAMRLLGKANEELGDWVAGLKWLRLAVAEAPGTREPWVALAEACYRRGLWPESYSAALSALEIKNKEEVYTMDPEVWGEKPYDLASIAAYNLGLIDQAIIYCKQAIELAPEDARLKANLQFMESKRAGLSTPEDTP